MTERVVWAQEAWRATIAACSVRGPLVFPTNRPGRAKIAVFLRFAHSLLIGTAARGEDQIKRVKTAASDLRQRIFEDDAVPRAAFFGLVDALGWSDPGLALQVTYIGRALPYGSASVVAASLDSHRKVLSEPFVTSPELLSAAREWASRWAKRQRLDLSLTHPSVVQESSTLEFSRKAGGLREGLRKALPRVDARPPSASPDELRVGDQKIASRLRASWFSMFYKGNLWNKGLRDTRIARVVAVPERGFKSRVVSAHSASRVAFSHQLRRSLAAALARDGRVREVVAGDHRKAIESMARGLRHDGVCLSADLTAASDLLPHDLLIEIIEGLLEGTRLIPGLTKKDVIDLALGPYELSYPDGSKVTTRRGILMGLPMTWPLLCLVQLFWVDLSKEAPDGQVSSGGSTGREAERICGDDLAAWWRPERVALYEDLAVRCGAKFSVGKHLRSRRWGIFTEEIFDLRQQVVDLEGTPVPLVLARAKTAEQACMAYLVRSLNAVLPRKFCPSVRRKPYRGPSLSTEFGRWSRCIPVRWAVRAPRRLPGDVVASLPDWYTVGPASWSVAAHGSRWKAVDNVRRVLFPGLGRELASVGAPPFLPRTLGGGGLPTPAGPSVRIGRVCSRKWRAAIGGGLYRSPVADLPSSAWRAASSPAYEVSLKEARKFFTRPDVRSTRRFVRGPPEYGFIRLGCPEEFLEARAGRGVFWAALETDFPLTREAGLGKAAVRQALNREVERLARLGGFLRPSAPVGRLVRKDGSRLLWWRRSEDAVVEPQPVSTVGGGLFAQLAARFGNPGG